jgi:ribosome-associated protein
MCRDDEERTEQALSPSKPQPTDPELEWVLAAARAADEKSATDIVIIDVATVLAITGHFMIATGRNARQVRSIGEEVEEQLMLLDGPKPLSAEGKDDYQWLLVDYGDFIVHVFDAGSREYYDLDRLWSDQPRVPFEPAGPLDTEG